MHVAISKTLLAAGAARLSQQPLFGVLGLGFAVYVIVRGAMAKELVLIPRRSGGDPLVFRPQWYHRLLMVFGGVVGAMASLRSLLGWP